MNGNDGIGQIGSTLTTASGSSVDINHIENSGM